MNRPEILEAARVCVCGEREQDYGKPEDNFETIGLLWGVYLRAAYPELKKSNGYQSHFSEGRGNYDVITQDCAYRYRLKPGQLC